MAERFQALVLAGQRPGGHPVARHTGVSHAVLAPLMGQPLIAHVCAALRASERVDSILLVGAPATDTHPALGELASVGIGSLAGAAGPAASVAAGLAKVGTLPVLVTTADHGLLTAAMVDEFCRLASASQADVVVGLADWKAVMAAYPAGKRTRHAFADGSYSGCNLFAFRTDAGRGLVALWQRIEAHRKRPWRMVALLGPLNLLRWLVGSLSLSDALTRLGKRAGCSIAVAPMATVEAAIDVDTVADLALAEQILQRRAAAAGT